MWERLRRMFGGTPEPRQDVVNKAVSLLVEGASIEESKTRAIHARQAFREALDRCESWEVTEVLVQTWDETYRWGQENDFPIYQEYPHYEHVRQIGHRLDDLYGMEMMQMTYMRAQERTKGYSELWWSGIGVWQ